MTILSLLLCLASAGVWVRSYWRCDHYGFSQLSTVYTDRGELVALVAQPDWNFTMEIGYGSDVPPDPLETYNPRRVSRRTWNLFIAHGEQSLGLSFTVAKLWAVVVFTGLLPALAIGRRLRRRRMDASGLCPICGYDLRATPERCPECGTIVEHPKQPTEAPHPMKPRRRLFRWLINALMLLIALLFVTFCILRLGDAEIRIHRFDHFLLYVTDTSLVLCRVPNDDVFDISTWWIIIGTGGLISLRILARRRSRYIRESRRLDGLCAECGYDLRATPERCPECGTIVEHPKRATEAPHPMKPRRRLLRWLINSITILSLLLCLASAGVWHRSQSTDGRTLLPRRYREFSQPARGMVSSEQAWLLLASRPPSWTNDRFRILHLGDRLPVRPLPRRRLLTGPLYAQSGELRFVPRNFGRGNSLWQVPRRLFLYLDFCALLVANRRVSRIANLLDRSTSARERDQARSLRRVWLRPPRHAGTVSGMWDRSGASEGREQFESRLNPAVPPAFQERLRITFQPFPSYNNSLWPSSERSSSATSVAVFIRSGWASAPTAGRGTAWRNTSRRRPMRASPAVRGWDELRERRT